MNGKGESACVRIYTTFQIENSILQEAIINIWEDEAKMQDLRWRDSEVPLTTEATISKEASILHKILQELGMPESRYNAVPICQLDFVTCVHGEVSKLDLYNNLLRWNVTSELVVLEPKRVQFLQLAKLR